MLALLASLVIANPDPCACETWYCSDGEAFHLYLAQYPNHGFLQGKMGGRAFAAAAERSDVGNVALICASADRDPRAQQDNGSSGEDSLVTSCRTVAEDIGGDFVIEIRRGDGARAPRVYAHAETYGQTIAYAVACDDVWRDASALPPPLLTPSVVWPDAVDDPVCDHPYTAAWPTALQHAPTSERR